jgi:PKD repeat protein
MVSAKLLLVGFVISVMVLAVQSCSKTPIACFTTTPSMDSIHRNQTVIFNANCSALADSYNWQFYDNMDSVNFTPIVTKVFKDSGTVNVYLLVTNGNNYAGMTQNITVLP